MTRLTLHIGQPKAASTSIQLALRDNADRLAAHGITYPIIAAQQHNAAVADFILTHPTAALADHPTAKDTIASFALPGAWDDLVGQVRAAERAIVSSEWFILMGSGLADRALDELTGGAPETASIVVVAREPSRSLPSIYSELARRTPTVGFEAWTRLTLLHLLGSGPHRVVSYLRVGTPRHAWRRAGEFTQVAFDPPQGAPFADALFEALGVSGVLEPSDLPRRNTRYPAAWIQAWQLHLRAHRDAPASDLRGLVKRLGRETPASAGGSFQLLPEVAALVDAALPRSGEVDDDVLAARRALLERAQSGAQLTSVGASQNEFAAAVEVCLAEIRRDAP